MNGDKSVPFWIRISMIWVAFKAASFMKTSFVAGSFWTSFSLSNGIGPLAGAFGGFLGSIVFFFGNIVVALLLKKSITLSFLAFSGIPTFFASLYWASSSVIVRGLIPLLCMLLFLLHPIGLQAAPYALFWFIPLAIALQRNQSLFATALGSTFVSHAVGSVIWLYTAQMDASYWYALLPVVPVERVVYAAGMAIGYRMLLNLFSSLSKKQLASIAKKA